MFNWKDKIVEKIEALLKNANIIPIYFYTLVALILVFYSFRDLENWKNLSFFNKFNTIMLWIGFLLLSVGSILVYLEIW